MSIHMVRFDVGLVARRQAPADACAGDSVLRVFS